MLSNHSLFRLEKDPNARGVIDYMAQSLEIVRNRYFIWTRVIRLMVVSCLQEQKESSFEDFCQEITVAAITTVGTTFQPIVATSLDDLVKDFGCVSKSECLK